MNTEQKNKYSIAWFSLSECIARGEREKALGVFRLLSHSLTDKALVHQLKGDIYCAFQDNAMATKEYLSAAQKYMHNNRLQAACALYEYIVSVQPDALEQSLILILLYYELGIISRAQDELVRIAGQLSKKESFELVCNAIDRAKNKTCATQLYNDLIRQLVSESADEGYIQMCLHIMLDTLIASNDQNTLQYFLQMVELIDIQLQQKALEYINA